MKTFNSTKRDPENNIFPFSHYANGFHFFCTRCDFGDDVIVKGNFENIQEKKNLVRYTKAVAEMISWHSMFILPHLTSFQGHDCVNYKLWQED